MQEPRGGGGTLVHKSGRDNAVQVWAKTVPRGRGTGGCSVQFQAPNPAAWVGGGGCSFSEGLAAFLNSLIQSGHFDYTQLEG